MIRARNLDDGKKTKKFSDLFNTGIIWEKREEMNENFFFTD